MNLASLGLSLRCFEWNFSTLCANYDFRRLLRCFAARELCSHLFWDFELERLPDHLYLKFLYSAGITKTDNFQAATFQLRRRFFNAGEDHFVLALACYGKNFRP